MRLRRRLSARLPRATPGQLVRGRTGAGELTAAHWVICLLLRAIGALTGQLREGAVNLLPDAAERDAEHALAPLEQVHDLVRGGALVHAYSVAHQGHPGEIVCAPVAQVVHGGADLLQRDAGVKEALDHLEHEDVAEAVQAQRARSARRPDAWLYQPGPRPVVELAVGDTGRRARCGTAVADSLRPRGEILPEEESLLAGVLDSRATNARRPAVAFGYRHACLRPGN